MASLRGLVTSLGAAGSLIAAALCALVIVGGILAMRDATGGTAGGAIGDVVMPDATDVARVRSGAADPAVPRAVRRTRVRGERPAARRPRAARRQTVAARPRRAEPRLDPASPPAEPVESSPPEPEPELAAPSAGDVRRVVSEARETVEPVVEATPEPVAPVVDQVAGIVDQVAGTVEEIVAPVTGLLP